jgi:cytochrome c peroxidase
LAVEQVLVARRSARGFLGQPALPSVAVPPDNPRADAKVALGSQVFFDPRLSRDNTISCATCHDLVAFMEALTGSLPKIDRLVGAAAGCRDAAAALRDV